jgi:hypothetical protein
MRLLESLATPASNFQRPCRGGAALGRSGGTGEALERAVSCSGRCDMDGTSSGAAS